MMISIFKKTLLVFVEILAFFIFPLYRLRVEYIEKVVGLIRSLVIKKYLQSKGAIIGDNFHVGKGVTLRVQNGAKINIGNSVSLGDFVMLNVREGALLSIGKSSHINFGSRVSCFTEILIGEDCLIASYANILDHGHKYDLMNSPSKTEYIKAGIKIEKGVWLGTKVQINKGTTIGKYAVVGSNSVVTKSLGEASVYGGIPAKLLKSNK